MCAGVKRFRQTCLLLWAGLVVSVWISVLNHWLNQEGGKKACYSAPLNGKNDKKCPIGLSLHFHPCPSNNPSLPVVKKSGPVWSWGSVAVRWIDFRIGRVCTERWAEFDWSKSVCRIGYYRIGQYCWVVFGQDWFMLPVVLLRANSHRRRCPIHLPSRITLASD